ncbi:hypothetical protein [Chryseobacterium sp. Leaf201]|uniref:hypothetical protein n=1 Tax=Chryseobacterium sp. Leaf201 TaxID=1735672 RepID=UPI0006FCEFEB|nr:hypothetical protein [Chryseobacterium sp. Leaf201]KQM19909.1 hypothetical protein ASE55_18610 [Chryseobacterium sp. Leaf201]
MKKLIVTVIVLLLYSCAPHSHYYAILNKKGEGELSVFCSMNDKIWTFDDKNNNDSIFIQSNHFPELKKPQIMDTLSFHQTETQKTFRLRINDKNFHKKIKDDTIFIKYKNNNDWVTETFIIINDNRIK